MKRQNDQSLGDALRSMVAELGLRPKLDELDAVTAWDHVAGGMIAKHTRSIKLRSNRLYIAVDSAPLKQELSYRKEDLVARLNERLGRTVVEQIVLT